MPKRARAAHDHTGHADHSHNAGMGSACCGADEYAFHERNRSKTGGLPSTFALPSRWTNNWSRSTAAIRTTNFETTYCCWRK